MKLLATAICYLLFGTPGATAISLRGKVNEHPDDIVDEMIDTVENGSDAEPNGRELSGYICKGSRQCSGTCYPGWCYQLNSNCNRMTGCKMIWYSSGVGKCRGDPYATPCDRFRTEYSCTREYKCYWGRSSPSPSPSCMSGETKVMVKGSSKDQLKYVQEPKVITAKGLSKDQPKDVQETKIVAMGSSKDQLKYVKDLIVGDAIRGLDENMAPETCSVEAVGHFGKGLVYGNYTDDHFILDTYNDVVAPNGKVGKKENVEKYAVLTSCPVGVDESGVGFTMLDSDFFQDSKEVSWSDYVLIHRSIISIVRQTGQFWFSPSTYTSMGQVKKYTGALYKTMLQCAKNADTCDKFERVAVDLVENALTVKAKAKAKKGFGKLGQSKREGSVSAAVSKVAHNI